MHDHNVCICVGPKKQTKKVHTRFKLERQQSTWAASFAVTGASAQYQCALTNLDDSPSGTEGSRTAPKGHPESSHPQLQVCTQGLSV